MNIFGKKSKKEVKPLSKEDISHSVSQPPVFGVPLTEAISRSKCHDGVKVPYVVRKCIDYVTQHGLLLEGIYRISAPKAKLDELERNANSGERELRFNDAHEASGLLKRFLRQLPQHILTEQLKPKFDSVTNNCKCNAMCTCSCVNELRELMNSLPCENYSLLAYIFIHAQAVVEQQKFNKMSLSALGVLLQAMLNLSKNQVRIFLLNAVSSSHQPKEGTGNLLFQNVDYKLYVPPSSLNELKDDLPEFENELQEEICKQQSLYESLQQNQSRTPNSSSIGQEIWEVEEAINMLTSKLTSVKGHLPSSLQEKFADEKTSQLNPTLASGCKDRVEAVEVSSMLLEKQLIAVQSSLKEEITAEKRTIVQLLTRLREIHSKLPVEVLEKMRRHRMSQEMKINPLPANGIPNRDEKAEAENRRKDELTKEVARLRNLCGQLRARLEEDSVLLTNTAICKAKAEVLPGLTHAQDKKHEEGAASLLVTRF